MSDSNSGNNSVAIVAIIVVGILVAAAGFMFMQKSDSPTVVEKEVVIEKPAEPKKEEPGFSFEFQDEDGNKAKIEGDS